MLQHRTGGSALPEGEVSVMGFRKGSGLRSEGGMRSGLEDPDLHWFLVYSVDFRFPETGTEAAAGVCGFGAGLLECPPSARGGVLLGHVLGSAGWDCNCERLLSLYSDGISLVESSAPSGGSCPPRCIRMWCWRTSAFVNLRWHSGQEFWTRAFGGRA